MYLIGLQQLPVEHQQNCFRALGDSNRPACQAWNYSSSNHKETKHRKRVCERLMLRGVHSQCLRSGGRNCRSVAALRIQFHSSILALFKGDINRHFRRNYTVTTDTTVPVAFYIPSVSAAEALVSLA